MRTQVVSLLQLGTRCWKFKDCPQCQRYFYCAYPERVPDEEYDRLKREADAAQEALRNYAKERRYPINKQR